jgi:hypothetical protein
MWAAGLCPILLGKNNELVSESEPHSRSECSTHRAVCIRPNYDLDSI